MKSANRNKAAEWEKKSDPGVANGEKQVEVKSKNSEQKGWEVN